MIGEFKTFCEKNLSSSTRAIDAAEKLESTKDVSYFGVRYHEIEEALQAHKQVTLEVEFVDDISVHDDYFRSVEHAISKSTFLSMDVDQPVGYFKRGWKEFRRMDFGDEFYNPINQSTCTVTRGWGLNAAGDYVEGGQYHFNKKGEIIKTLPLHFYDAQNKYISAEKHVISAGPAVAHAMNRGEYVAVILLLCYIHQSIVNMIPDGSNHKRRKLHA